MARWTKGQGVIPPPVWDPRTLWGKGTPNPSQEIEKSSSSLIDKRTHSHTRTDSPRIQGIELHYKIETFHPHIRGGGGPPTLSPISSPSYQGWEKSLHRH